MTDYINNSIFIAAGTGIGNFTVAGAVQGYLTPAGAGGVDGQVFNYKAQNADRSQWEVGTGTLTNGGTQLTRTPLLSSNANGLVNFLTVPTVAVSVWLSSDVAALTPNLPATVAPLMDGVAAVGVATKYAREDHVHPVDTSRAPLNSPALTGTPTAPTPANADNSTKIATTAWVQTNAPGTAPATVAPLMDGVAAVGVATKYAREDHVHPVDTSRAPLASPSFTGTPTTAATPTVLDNSLKLATTAYVDRTTRFKATANINLYVATTGNDSNPGTVGSPFLTIQKAVNTLASYDCGVYDGTINVANGTYTAPVNLKPVLGAGVYKVLGNTGSPGSVIISTTNANCFLASALGPMAWWLDGMELRTTTAGTCIFANGAGVTITIGTLNFGAAAGIHIRAWYGAQIQVAAPYTVNGNCSNHIDLINGLINCTFNTITISGSPTIAKWLKMDLSSNALLNGNTYSGSPAAGTKKYELTLNSIASTAAGTLPGTVAGTADASSVYS